MRRARIIGFITRLSLTGALFAVSAGLSACASDPPADLMVPCGARTVPPQPPKSGTRNLSNIVGWANQVQLAREATDRTLADCADRHSGLIKWVREH